MADHKLNRGQKRYRYRYRYNSNPDRVELLSIISKQEEADLAGHQKKKKNPNGKI